MSQPPAFMGKYRHHAYSTTDVRPEAVEAELGVRSGSWVVHRGIRNWGFSTVEDKTKFLIAYNRVAGDGWAS